MTPPICLGDERSRYYQRISIFDARQSGSMTEAHRPWGFVQRAESIVWTVAKGALNVVYQSHQIPLASVSDHWSEH